MNECIPMMIETDERILCAAIYIDDGQQYPHQPKNVKTGFVLCGYRHCSILGQKLALDLNIIVVNSYQGFLTNKNRFVSRSEAKAIATARHQCIKDTNSHELFSEDLY